MSLVKHPDKQPNNPNAAQEFDELKRARDVLLEPSAKAALDDVLRCVFMSHVGFATLSIIFQANMS